jgi:L-fuculose-phosphate aldolase
MTRATLLAAARRASQLGLAHGTTGNLSLRTARGMLITPTAVPYDQLDEDGLVEMALDGGTVTGGTPSSEWRLHAAIYQARRDAGAVVHAHPRFSTTLACLREDLPPVHYIIAATGAGRVRCSRYATFATAELASAAVEALGAAGACLLANHGLVTVGQDPERALAIAEQVEWVAEYYVRGRGVGRPVPLSPAEVEAAIARFRSYGAGRGSAEG